MREKVTASSLATKADGGRQLHGDIGIGADGIDALDDVLQHRPNL